MSYCRMHHQLIETIIQSNMRPSLFYCRQIWMNLHPREIRLDISNNFTAVPAALYQRKCNYIFCSSWASIH